jgi:hypothetical protein
MLRGVSIIGRPQFAHVGDLSMGGVNSLTAMFGFQRGSPIHNWRCSIPSNLALLQFDNRRAI